MTNLQLDIKSVARALGANNGYRVLVDGEQLVFKRYCKSLENELNSIVGVPALFRNMNGELAIDYRDESEKH